MPSEEEHLLVYGNAELLNTAVKNIVLNACKYSVNHLAVARLKVQPGEIIVEIIDDGPGVPSNEMENIFQPFYRTTTASGEKGFGLGLSLANQIIKLHKGFIKVDHAGSGGSVFIITLPANQQ
jgi:signal transduction histidine kinase